LLIFLASVFTPLYTPWSLSSRSEILAERCRKDAGVEDKSYAFELELFEPIDASLTKKNLTTRHLQLILRKKEAKDEFWPRLTKEKVKNQFIKTDFAKVRSDFSTFSPLFLCSYVMMLIAADVGLVPGAAWCSGLTRTSRRRLPLWTTPSSRAELADLPAWAAWEVCPVWEEPEAPVEWTWLRLWLRWVEEEPVEAKEACPEEWFVLSFSSPPPPISFSLFHYPVWLVG
jgi:hypothetical protein